MDGLELGIKQDYFFAKYVKYYIFRSSGHGSVPQNNEQPLKLLTF